MRLLFSFNRRCVVLPALLVLSLAACDDKNRIPPPNTVLPNSSELTEALFRAKSNSEKEAREATRLLRARLNQGKGLYEDARAAHALAISQMRQALVARGKPLSTGRLQKLFSDADGKRHAFHDWCNGTYKAEYQSESGWCQSCALVDVVLDVASLYTEWVKIQEARDQQQRAVILQELEKCNWVSWDAARGQ